MAIVSDAAVAMSLDDRIFELILMPTEKCNFRCTYCYEDFAIGRMKPRTIAAIKKLLDSRGATLRHLSFSWFGGEPMLAPRVILELASHAAELSKSHGFLFNGGMTTNGYLLDEPVIRQLHSLRHDSYQITLDGVASRHDETRVLANGRGTFDRIWRNLEMMRDLDLALQIKLRVHVTPANKRNVPELLRRINGELAGSNKFAIHFHRVSDLGGPGGGAVEELGWQEYGDLLARFSEIAGIPSSSEHALAAQGYICYAAKPNSLLVRADGRIAKCTVALNDPRNDVGVLNDDGTISFRDERLRLWFEGYRELDARVLGCPLPSLGPIDAGLPRGAAIPVAVV